MEPIERFATKCAFDPVTGCVLWTGGTTSGQGNTARYGSFWYARKRWFAHRWAAKFIHGLEIDGLTVGHVCPGGPNTLCMHHLEAQTLSVNVAEGNRRRGGPGQTNAARQYWLLVGLGHAEPPERPQPTGIQIPFPEPPAWFKPFYEPPNPEITECPF